jgi:hypothetical protein
MTFPCVGGLAEPYENGIAFISIVFIPLTGAEVENPSTV